MSKRTAARAAAIAAALARLSNSFDKRKQRQRDEAYDALRKQLAEGQLRDQQYSEQTRPTIEQKLAELDRQRQSSELSLEGQRFNLDKAKEDREFSRKDREYQASRRTLQDEGDALDLESKRVALAKAKEPKEIKRRSIEEIGKELGVGDEDRFTAFQALEESDNDFDRAIKALSGPNPNAKDDDDILGQGGDPRARGRLLLQRARRELGPSISGAAAPGPRGEGRKHAESQIDATTMRSVMDHAAMIQNPQAPFEDKVQGWLTLERLGMVKAPQEVHDWVKYGAKTQQQAEQLQGAGGPAPQETRVPEKPPRPIRMSSTTTADDRANIERRRKVVPATAQQRQMVDYYTRGKTPVRGPGEANNYPRDYQVPVQGRRIQGPPYRQPEMGPPYQGVSAEQSRQMDLDAFLQSQREQMQPAPVDPIQSMFDRIRGLREMVEDGRAHHPDPVDDLVRENFGWTHGPRTGGARRSTLPSER